jgi:dipeptidyl-peptidase-4
VAALPSAPPSYDPAALPRWEIFTLPGPGGVRLPARRLVPPGFDPAKRYPVIMYHYGCPASQVVLDRWEGRGRGLWHKLMAERGYVVLAVDNEGSMFFGKAGEDRMHRRFGPLEHAAQLAAVEYLKAQPWADPERLGLWGWSGGGANTLYDLLRSPGVWAAGIAGAPVTDWHLYDTIWTERYLDSPDGNEEGYEASSPVTYADRLADPLLIIHGTGDDNVHPQNTIVMSHALIEAGKPFDQAIYPRQKHGFRGISARHVYERMSRFFDRELAAAAERVPQVETEAAPLP